MIAPPETAPDGSLVEPLIRTDKGSLARFILAPGAVTLAVSHRSIEEFWYVLEGRGKLWRSTANGEASFLHLAPGVHAHIAVGTTFQFRADEAARLIILGTTMPPWPGDEEAVPGTGTWAPS